MTLYKNKYRVETTRLKVWDYANPWWYFVTINTKNHEYYFGSIVNDLMGLNKLGEKTQELWNDIPKHYPVVELDYYVIMPNHVHGIIIINNSPIVETGYIPSQKDEGINLENETPCMASLQQTKKQSLSIIIGTYKAAVTRWCRQNEYLNFSWQSRFYDRIIRNEKELFKIRKYIYENPLQWELEKDAPENLDI